MNDNPDPRLYTVNEAAALLSLDRSTVYKYIDKNTLKTVKLGRSTRITSNELRRFISSLEELGEIPGAWAPRDGNSAA